MKIFQLSEKLLNRIADLIQAKKDTQLKKLVKDIHYADMAEIINELNQDQGTYLIKLCLLYTSPSPRDATLSRMPSSA